MKAISLFSGVGGFDLGLERAGIETVLQAEIDPWCNKVLSRHWPDTRRVEDVRCIGLGRAADHQQDKPELAETRLPDVERGRLDVDLVYGGFPCQPFSVAGKRAGLGDERDLWPEFRRVLSELRSPWAILENVPGLLSACGCEACFWCGVYLGRHARHRGHAYSCPLCAIWRGYRSRHKGFAFKRILTDLAELGFGGVGWGVLDAQHFGVPQRRRRVFVVAGPTAESVASVLSLCESCGGNPETGGTPGEGVAYSLTAGVRGTGDGHGNAWNSNYVATDYQSGMFEEATVAGPLTGSTDRSRGAPLAIRTAQAGSNGWGVNENLAYTLDGANGQAVLAASVSASAGHHGHSIPRGDGSDNLVVANPLGAHHGRQDLPHDTYVPDIVGALSDGAHHGGGLNGQDAYTGRILAPSNGVRRLTPLECERLQGWPDDWTRWAADGSEIPDSHRYRMIGNGVASPVAEWIGHRLMAVLR